MYTYIRIHTYIYIYTYTHIRIYIHVHGAVEWSDVFVPKPHAEILGASAGVTSGMMDILKKMRFTSYLEGQETVVTKHAWAYAPQTYSLFC